MRLDEPSVWVREMYKERQRPTLEVRAHIRHDLNRRLHLVRWQKLGNILWLHARDAQLDQPRQDLADGVLALVRGHVPPDAVDEVAVLAGLARALVVREELVAVVGEVVGIESEGLPLEVGEPVNFVLGALEAGLDEFLDEEAEEGE